MDLGNIFKKQEETEPEFFWSLVIAKNWVEAGIWRVVGEKTEVISRGAGSSWQEGDEKTLVPAADSALSAAAASFETEAQEPSKVVFGLPPSWVENGQIKQERLELLKKLSGELELTPAGFVVIPEAIAHYLKSKEGAPLSAILVGIVEDSIELALVEAGKIVGIYEVGRSISLAADVQEGLARFSLPQYPSRIVLYNHRVADLEEARQSLIDAEWEEAKIKFLHTPKVEILEDEVIISAVSLAGGAEVGQAKSVEMKEEGEEPASPERDELREVTPEEFGFGTEDGSPTASPPKPPLPQPPAAKTPRTFWAKEKLAHLPKIRTSALGAVAAVLAGLLVVGGIGAWILPKAEVTVYVAPKRLEKTIEFTVDPQIQVIDQEKRVLPGRIAQAQVTGEKTRQATGVKTVGERARGSVTIYRTGPAISLAPGTILTSSNGLKFTLNNQVQVASGSAVKRGEVEAQVTSAEIGAQYNLAAQTTFTVGNFSDSDLGAQNPAAFTGGSSREVAAVSREDRETLEKELLSELESRARDQIKKDLGENEILVEASSAIRVTDRNFSHKEGEEADTLRLKLTAQVDTYAVAKESFTTLVQPLLTKDIPDGFSLREDQTEVTFSRGEEAFTAKIQANLLPKVDPSEVARSVSGKYPETAREILTGIPGFTRAEINLKFGFPGKLGTLPRLAKNITVEIAAER